jgi:DNA-binding transcriptional LysR family regulator
MDKLRALRFFCRIAETSSFAAAAYELDVVPSVLSKTIAALESSVHFKLFNRTTRRVSLTEGGARYYVQCKQLLIELEEAELLGLYMCRSAWSAAKALTCTKRPFAARVSVE